MHNLKEIRKDFKAFKSAIEKRTIKIDLDEIQNLDVENRDLILKKETLEKEKKEISKSKDKSLVVVEDFSFDAPKTKDFVNFLSSLGIENKKSLIVLGGTNNNVYLSSRNLDRSEVVTGSELNTYKIVNATSLVLTESALEGIESNLKK